MCVIMVGTSAATSRVGVRELRQNLSVYLRRIDRGERFEVTDRGRPVALLVPLPSGLSPLQRLIAEGRVRAPAGDPRDLPLPEGEPSNKVSEALIRDRREHRF